MERVESMYTLAEFFSFSMKKKKRKTHAELDFIVG